MHDLLPRFFFSKHDHNGLIIAAKKPFIIGKVWKFNDREKLDEWIARQDAGYFAAIAGYNIAIGYYASMAQVDDEFSLKNELALMATWYLETTIKGNGYFKRYRQTAG